MRRDEDDVLPPRVVALRALKLGDLLVAVPALRALRRAFPNHLIQLATSGWLAPVVRLTRAVDQVLPTRGLAPLGPLAWRPDVAVNLHGAGPRSSQVLDAVRPRRRIGHAGAGWSGPAWRDDIHERERWCRLLAAHDVPADPDDLLLARPDVASPAPGAVVLHPGAAHGSRHWPVDRFVAVARTLVGRGLPVVVTGAGAERERAEEVAALAGLPDAAVLAGRTDLPQLTALVADARLVISADTGVAHLSYAYRTPSVVLFGPVPAAWWGPPANGPHVALSDDAARRGDPFAADPDPALLGVGVDAVLDAVDRLLPDHH
ncbi:ADP-heptose:LPS heptosyltransferase [Streptoalloteichus tenebrarius]|uniref:ADP-heptose:LPS heptosyltransferase n=1 Tax=Streptoalloteichus tenebrarius (strain ATCC 17920 / DSM 40477 / JCM 4838 / CBS 697.72 / NBRC 16177 / NCIMB 11028 / NRRL B-12390 / A12253. 1 / ISP 5477) TaxID=1933 RepID=A0ABT1I241_STRSD|nr:glycosyltransferase family 9 protein [Streptoalloteichus tenebrarius]MCP2261844.1 ADP-heptose:LPS heptosyltransferase [Streptoalloteichus tenebrarius]BFE99989.1 glycosyltransferase family 9 protein [Streptoalloteichus tenebrarius]